jgi:hypothetical protein
MLLAAQGVEAIIQGVGERCRVGGGLKSVSDVGLLLEGFCPTD